MHTTLEQLDSRVGIRNIRSYTVGRFRFASSALGISEHLRILFQQTPWHKNNLPRIFLTDDKVLPNHQLHRHHTKTCPFAPEHRYVLSFNEHLSRNLERPQLRALSRRRMQLGPHQVEPHSRHTQRSPWKSFAQSLRHTDAYSESLPCIFYANAAANCGLIDKIFSTILPTHILFVIVAYSKSATRSVYLLDSRKIWSRSPTEKAMEISALMELRCFFVTQAPKAE